MARKNPRNRRPVEIPNRTKIYCPLKHLIGELRGNFRAGDTPHISRIRFEHEQRRTPGEPMTCVLCGQPYAKDGNIRTEEGWKPSTPRFERPMPLSLRRSARKSL